MIIMRVIVVAILLVASSVLAASAQNDCARTCHEVNCTEIGIRYGKYCGVGHGGCQGEEPCDAVDACCKRHDNCVDKKGALGMLSNNCHKKFIKCLERVSKSGKEGFSKQCPWNTVVPVMKAGISMAMAFGSDEL